MKKLLIVALVCYGFSTSAQVDESQDFVYLYSDSLLRAERVTFRPGIIGDWQLRADSRKLNDRDVKFFNSKDGFFANTRKLHPLGYTEFAERVTKGNINLYQQTDYDNSFVRPGYRFADRRRSSVNGNLFYNKGFGDVKRVNYRNLREDMSDNEQSIDVLAGYRKSLNTSRALYISAGVSALASIISFWTQTNSMDIHKDANFTPGYVLVGAGLGLAIGGFGVHMNGARKLERAIDVYNR